MIGRSGRVPDRVLLGIAVVVVAAAGVGVGFLLGGGGDSGGGVVETVADDLLARSDGMLTEDEAACTAQGLADNFGRERLVELGEEESGAGLRTDRMTDEETRTFATVSYGCVGDGNIVRHLAEMWMPFQDTTSEERTCFAEGFVQNVGAQRAREALVELYVEPTTDIHELLEGSDTEQVANVENRCFESAGGS